MTLSAAPYLRQDETDPKTAYIRRLFAAEDAPLTAISGNTPDDMKQMQMGADEAKLLHLFASMIGAKTIVEIGTLGGYSAVWMARALPADGHLYTIDQSEERRPQILENLASCGVAERVTLLTGRAEDVLKTLSEKGPFDMVVIDADKISYDAYLDWAEANVRSGGLIIGDNSLLFGAVYEDDPNRWPERVKAASHAAMRKFNERLANSENYISMLLPTAEGMTVAMKR